MAKAKGLVSPRKGSYKARKSLTTCYSNTISYFSKESHIHYLKNLKKINNGVKVFAKREKAKEKGERERKRERGIGSEIKKEREIGRKGVR